MVDKTIGGLTPGKETQTSAAIIETEQGGASFNTTVRPNPEKQRNIRNQAQLEAELGVNLEIPDGVSITISIDKSFTLTKPFLIGDGSSLEIIAPNVETVLTYDDPGNTLFQQNTANPIRALIIGNIQFTSANNTEVLMDGMIGSSRLFVADTLFTNFGNLGEITFPFVKFNSVGFVNVGQGFILTRVTTLVMRASNIRNPSTLGATAISVISDGIPITLLISDSLTSQLLAGDTMFYFDVDSPAGILYSVKDTTVAGGGDFYQTGVNANADAIAGAPAGNIRLTVTGHNLNVGQVVNVSGFTVNTGYNATTPVTAIIDVNTVEVRGTFVAPETSGNLNANSLDSTSIFVSSRDNFGVSNSMSQAEAISGTTLVVDGSGGIDVPIQDLTPAPGDWIQDPNTEEFTVDDTTGIITYNGIEDKTYVIQYLLTAVPSSGGSQVLDFDIHINGVQQGKSLIEIDTSVTSIGAYTGGLFVLSNGDTIQLFKNNLTNTNNTDISKATVLITSA